MFVTILVLGVVLFGCSDKTSETPKGKSGENGVVSGGELKVAIPTQPPTLDAHMSTALVTRDVSRQIFETLVASNENFEPVPMLAESIDVSDDGKTYTFHLRKGVKFHNGKEMTAEDVLVSMNRWLGKSGSAQAVIKGAKFEAGDDGTVLLKVEQASALTLNVLASTNQFAAIMPKEVIEAASETGVEEYIGTGPFKFVEWKHDQNIHLAKFDDYQPVDLPASGLAGKKEAYVDDLYFEFVPDSSTRLTGIQTGQYNITDDMPRDNYQQLNSDPNLSLVTSFSGYLSLTFNKNQGPFTDIKMRQAVNAALDVDSILKGALMDGYRADSSYMLKENVLWFSEKGKDQYNQHDTNKAKQLLKEAGYNGEEITILSTKDVTSANNATIIVKEQLEKLGMKIKLELYDWPTTVAQREQPDKWHLFISGFAQAPTPAELLFFGKNFYGGPVDEKTTEMLQEINTAPSIEEAKKTWDELQEYAWEYLPIIKFGDVNMMQAVEKKVEGFKYFYGPVLWNTKITK